MSGARAIEASVAMTSSDGDGLQSFDPRGDGLRLPTVAVVIVNHNYGRFIGAAIQSVLSQTYPRIECLVVDNGSTDDSLSVLVDAARRYAGLRLLLLPRNEGQTAACIRGLNATSGPYVIFLDGDDRLLANGVAVHAFVHLASREHVGFTSGDMLQSIGDEVVLTTGEAVQTVLRTQGRDPDLLRSEAAIFEALRPLLTTSPRVALIPPTQRNWVWSPTSGNCFRRDALLLFFDAAGLDRLSSQTDLFAVSAVNAICGSILIDEPVFAYRIHGSNVFTNRAQMRGTLPFDARLASDQANEARRIIIEHLIARIGRFASDQWGGRRLLRVIGRFDHEIEVGSGRLWPSHAGKCGLAHVSTLAAAIGFWPTLWFLARHRVSPVMLFRLAWLRVPSRF